MKIIHVADLELTRSGGVARVSFHWKEAFEAAGHEFLHVGLAEAGRLPHRKLFAWKVLKKIRSMDADCILASEPTSGVLLGANIPVVLFSHGLEKRHSEVMAEAGLSFSSKKRSFVNYILRQYWCDLGLKKARHLLLVSGQDKEYAVSEYGRSSSEITVFLNGVGQSALAEDSEEAASSVLFMGTWIPRKGTAAIVAAAKKVHSVLPSTRWILAGTSKDRDEILLDWPEELRSRVEVIREFDPEVEPQIHAMAKTFILPSLFEGQPLSLLEAMRAGSCCITTNCCGQKDLIQSNETGLLVEPGDADALSNAILTSLRDPVLRRRLGTAAAEKVKGRTWELVSKDVVDVVIRAITR